MTTNYGIQYQPLSQTIATGRLNKARTLFLDKQDVTEPAISAVIDYALKASDGVIDMDGEGSKWWRITVEEMGDNHA